MPAQNDRKVEEEVVVICMCNRMLFWCGRKEEIIVFSKMDISASWEWKSSTWSPQKAGGRQSAVPNPGFG